MRGFCAVCGGRDRDDESGLGRKRTGRLPRALRGIPLLLWRRALTRSFSFCSPPIPRRSLGLAPCPCAPSPTSTSRCAASRASRPRSRAARSRSPGGAFPHGETHCFLRGDYITGDDSFAGPTRRIDGGLQVEEGWMESSCELHGGGRALAAAALGYVQIVY